MNTYHTRFLPAVSLLLARTCLRAGSQTRVAGPDPGIGIRIMVHTSHPPSIAMSRLPALHANGQMCRGLSLLIPLQSIIRTRTVYSNYMCLFWLDICSPQSPIDNYVPVGVPITTSRHMSAITCHVIMGYPMSYGQWERGGGGRALQKKELEWVSHQGYSSADTGLGKSI